MPRTASEEDSVKELIRKLCELKKSHIADLVDKRLSEFKAMRERGSHEWFSELCFCILTANYTAEGGMRMQVELGYDGFAKLSKMKLAERLRKLGHRFPNSRASYIVEARKYACGLKETLLKIGEEYEMREWLVRNVRGIGYKEASHFLRNVGFENLAILDRHIIKVMRKYGLARGIVPPEGGSLSRKRYLLLERKLADVAKRARMSLGELDLYLWHIETGKILK
ncbi:MAG: N-glycosylase/DNA lyase [Candidatus Micrarchaeia archaeon]